MLGCWICVGVMRKGQNSRRNVEKLVFNMGTIKNCHDVWKLKLNAGILWEMTKAAENCIINRIISAKLLNTRLD